jgi:hypothetical protein
MNDPAAEAHIVRDVARGPAESWRWAGRNPTFRVYLGRTEDVRYHLEFTIADATFKETGPVTVTFLVNDKEIGKQRCDKPGSRTWESAIDPRLLAADAENTFGASVDKVWTSPQDKSQLGLIISSAGLVH